MKPPLGSPISGNPLPAPTQPEAGPDPALAAFLDEEQPSDTRLRVLAPTVALAIADPALRASLSAVVRGAGRSLRDDDSVPVAEVVVTDAMNGAKATVTGLRTRVRSDAAIIAVLGSTAPDTELVAAYEAGAVSCLRAPVVGHQLLAAIGSALDLHAARAQADDLMRQLDVQAHLASLGRVTAGFTHEVSNPLAALVANFETVRENLEWLLQARDLVARGSASPKTMRAAQERMSHVAPGDVRGALGDMGEALGRMQSVLETARELAQAEHAERFEDMDLVLAVREARRWAASDLQGVEVEELFDEPVVGRADPRLLRQIVINLVTNSAHAARQLPSPRVRLHVYGSNDAAIVSVRDNGPGIPSDIRDRIFEPFFTTRRDQGGTGLGLALCREYATRMRARLTLWTAPGRGACFRLHLRRAAP